MADWNASDSLALYNVSRWGAGYFGISEQGDVTVRDTLSGAEVSFADILQMIQARGLELPVLIRFPHILHHRVASLVDSFARAIENEEYQGRFISVYPIKVNQQREVVEAIVAGQRQVLAGNTGLEAGSKPELLAVLAMSEPGKSTVICNGYKDEDYIRLALTGERLGHKVYIVLEKSSELNDVLRVAAELKVQPRIGVRARLSTVGKGNWQDSGGLKSKFGLSASEILKTIEILRSHDQVQAFQLLHFHLGSQIANIQDIQVGLREAACFYAQLRLMGMPVEVADVGGGLGIDYEGTASRSICSMNYTLDEYAKRVVQAFKEVALEHDLPQPHLISESGRAVTAHHAVLVTNVIGIERQEVHSLAEPEALDHLLLQRIWQNYQDALGRERSLSEVYHDLVTHNQDLNHAFTHGDLSLVDRASGEQMMRATALYLMQRLNPAKRHHSAILDELNEQMADKLFANFSLFQSLPDVWGINQIFPILPLRDLDKYPSRRGVIRDITCDSDGRIDQYVDGEGLETTLPYPPMEVANSLLGFFLVGAYQEILGDLHNLFGDTDAANVEFNQTGSVEVSHMQRGDTVAKVLQYVNFNPEKLLESLNRQVAASDLSAADKKQTIRELRMGMDDTTYLEQPNL
ncbi:biosynthetic arginine decarboxylase [Nitrincola iocasae]|uniref:Arginine decarboxylase n=1 Tax=Nitrincola iocasae TaxID=2614693 RepID=A0A5J6LBC9_9GAMM|nr:biosynthetic arginine decarboxylase [Nitrincola iocasae]QEW06004.1 biosynthetic arginine decarboxylase [Nitrincola iocasae]